MKIQSSRFRPLMTRGLTAAALALPVAAAALWLAVTPAVVHAQNTAWTDAEVRKVDKEGGKLTLKHAEIKNLDMPPMTMVFKVREKAMLEGLAPGAKIRIRAAQVEGQYTVTELQRAP